MSPRLRPTSVPSGILNTYSRLATIDMGGKLRGSAPFFGRGAGCPSSTMWPGPRLPPRHRDRDDADDDDELLRGRIQEDVVSRRHGLRQQVVVNDDVDVGEVVVSSSRRRRPSVAGRPTSRVRQEAAQRVHAFHEGETTARHRRVHSQGVGRHQPDSRQKGIDCSVSFIHPYHCKS